VLVGAILCQNPKSDPAVPTMNSLLYGRALTGLGAGVILASSRQALDCASGQSKSAVWHMSSILYASGIAVGPAFGGSLLDDISWSWYVSMFEVKTAILTNFHRCFWVISHSSRCRLDD
jgi:MFS family permease